MSIAQHMETIVRELVEAQHIGPGHIVVIGTSTSEVAGKRIGTAGAEEVAAQLYEGLRAVQRTHRFDVAFQSCEHLNRALVIERAVLQRANLSEVSAIPVPHAGGSMASYAFRKLEAPCLVEHIQADAGIDIGDTLIGMHLRPVAVPFRASLSRIGEAHVTAAYTRPKLIGGARAVYELND